MFSLVSPELHGESVFMSFLQLVQNFMENQCLWVFFS